MTKETLPTHKTLCITSQLLRTIFRSCDHMEEVTRDFFEGVGPASSGVDPNNRLALHNIIKHVDVSQLDWKQVGVQLQ